MRILPPAPLLADLVRTTLWIWAGLHLAFAFAGVGSTGPMAPVTIGMLLGLAVLFVHLDRKSRGLDLFLANLGFPGRHLGILSLAVAAAAEVTLLPALVWVAGRLL
jgi:hypothetical protein